MKNGILLFIFRVRYKSPEDAYPPYVSMYYVYSKNGKGVLFQPFETYTQKPPIYGLWSDLDHNLCSIEQIADYFGVSPETAIKISEEADRFHESTRGVRLIEVEEMLPHINTELKKAGLPTYKSMDDLYAYTEKWWAEVKKNDPTNIQ